MAQARTAGIGTVTTAALSVFLALLAAGAFLVVRGAERDRASARALETAFGLENAIKASRPAGPEAVRQVFAEFAADGLVWAHLVGPAGVVLASTDATLLDGRYDQPLAPQALATGDVQVRATAGTTGTPVHEVVIPVRHAPPPPHARGPHLGFGHWFAPRDLVLVVGVEASPVGWMRNWALAQALASLAVIAGLIVAHLRGRRAEVALRALEADRRRREVLARLGEVSAVLAHEIRNPLAAVKGHVQLAIESVGGTAAPSPVSTRLATVVDEVARVETLVRGLLDYAKERPLIRGRTTLAAVVARGVDLARARGDLPAPALSIEVPEGIAFDADAEQVERVVANLVQNAIEAAGADGRVRVTGRAARGGVELAVEDSGPGIPEGLAGRLFEPFVTGRIHGVGLGLAIASRIVEAHGGTIRAGASADLGGARFDVRLPAGGLA